MKPVLQALSGQTLTPPPLWLMRQAGRYLPEYREIRAKAGGFLDLCFTPELASEVTVQPVRRFGLDAAILFSDILVVPHFLGQELSFAEGEGPRLGTLDVDKLKTEGWQGAMQPIFETIRLTKPQLPEGCAMIGFAGSPWTVACYMAEGRSSEDYSAARAMARAKPSAFEKLIDRIITCTVDYLEGQIEAGAEVIQLFDSWAGKCDNFHRWVIEPTAAIVTILKFKYPHIPIIGFPRHVGSHLTAYAAHTGVDGIGLDHSVDLEAAVKTLSGKVTLQGNLDPALLLKGGPEMKAEVERILALAKQRPFIFNLGHGIDKETPPEHVAELVRLVRG